MSASPDVPLAVTRRLKKHTVVQLFVNESTEVYAWDLGDGAHHSLCVNNVEIYGSLDRLEEVVAAMGELLAVLRRDPDVFRRWSDAGRVGHPLLRSLPGKF